MTEGSNHTSPDVPRVSHSDLTDSQRDEAQHSLQELQHYQLRLEMQNRELREAQFELQQARNRLADLYDYAPIAYVTLDERGCIEEINLTGSTFLGVNRPELLGKPFVRFVNRDHVRDFLLHMRRCLETDARVISEVVLDVPAMGIVHTQLLSVRVPDAVRRKNVFRTALSDISARKKTEDQIQRSLREKEVLLKELHHRVKNNLQTISSLLELQSGYVKDPHSLTLFRETQDMVRSMGLVHEKLYRSSDLSTVDFAEYINPIATNLFRSYGVNPDRVQLEVDVDRVAWGIDTAIPVSLIINELISNSLKYAFPEGHTGIIRVELRAQAGNKYTLTVTDNGIGIPEGVDPTSTQTLGLQLIDALAHELEGTVRINRECGTCFTITFSAKEPDTAL